ncbi:Nitrogen fixation protein VnfA [Caulifigura coniformis]|uniref:Nitrogen fixation protein VnfA n=1 Tax=Caulifigura coniformis TaxID=2527983 RepID=A0A517SG06_9PLAN|nr:sigma-54-dependent Fis family transcriptional regulator [Caulifigura coniformis]QDT55062.1 Nitrogen fixation protein VnfA [Caulifigura coniformis]
MPARWLAWSDLPWLQRSQPNSQWLHLSDRLASVAAESSSPQVFRSSLLSPLSMEFGASWSAIVERRDTWQVIAEQGMKGGLPLPVREVEEAADRDAAGWIGPHDDQSLPVLVAPLSTRPQSALVLMGRVSAEQLSPLLAMARVISTALSMLTSAAGKEREATRLRAILEISRRLANETETQPLLETIAREATRLLDCDRASIFIWDREQKQLVASPALGVSGGKLYLPDSKGIVGNVIQTGAIAQVDEAYSDPRFDQSVDKANGYRTRNLLCVPLVNGANQRIGAFELINKNRGDFNADDQRTLIDLGAQAAVAIENARRHDQLVRSNKQLTERVMGGVEIIGDSPAMNALRGTIDRLANTDLPVLILGESGTGKEVAAQSLHYMGPRSNQPFIAVNCAALTETLLESELFGHEKGAFTDAHQTREGKFELAEGGTLFLDEIGDMSLGGQAKLLRVLEQKVITRVGGSQTIPINVRVLAATNASLADMVRDKKFRQDLYYRLSVVTLDIPPLRDRPEDILPLAEFFLERFCRQANRKKLVIGPEAAKRLQLHGWPGNVRELRNLMERVAFLTAGDQVGSEDLAFILSPQRDAYEDLSEGIGLAEATDRFQQEYIRRAIKRAQNNMSDAARVLGLHRSNLYRKMKQLGLPVDEAKITGGD